MNVPIVNFAKAVEVLRKRKKMTLEEFAHAMGYTKFRKHYIMSTIIPRALTLVADEKTRRCFRLVRDALAREYYVEWVCVE